MRFALFLHPLTMKSPPQKIQKKETQTPKRGFLNTNSEFAIDRIKYRLSNKKNHVQGAKADAPGRNSASGNVKKVVLPASPSKAPFLAVKTFVLELRHGISRQAYLIGRFHHENTRGTKVQLLKTKPQIHIQRKPLSPSSAFKGAVFSHIFFYQGIRTKPFRITCFPTAGRPNGGIPKTHFQGAFAETESPPSGANWWFCGVYFYAYLISLRSICSSPRPLEGREETPPPPSHHRLYTLPRAPVYAQGVKSRKRSTGGRRTKTRRRAGRFCSIPIRFQPFPGSRCATSRISFSGAPSAP